ncbi:glutamate rich 3-like isoform X2 [Melanerpes formicivorus]|uniref:glutamate rich 3-like isoform X2 n=1 Tax=Melanerpes formicivorus TaxID=211600 RepID=UPI00358E5B8F
MGCPDGGRFVPSQPQMGSFPPRALEDSTGPQYTPTCLSPWSSWGRICTWLTLTPSTGMRSKCINSTVEEETYVCTQACYWRKERIMGHPCDSYPPVAREDDELGERIGVRPMKAKENVTARCLPQLPLGGDSVMPLPHPPGPKEHRSAAALRNGMPRWRQVCPITAPDGQLSTKSSGGLHRPSVHPNVCVTMVFLGKKLQLAHPDTQHRDEIKVYQHHCGGRNLCVYTGMLLEKEAFQFTSRRHHGFPFSLTFFLNGMQVDRLSCCCEFKLQKRSRLGGSRGYFGFLHVEGASPCSRCDVDSSLDQKPSPPKKKAEESHEGKPVGPLGDGVQDGALLAEGRRTPEERKAAGTEEAGEEMALLGGLLPKEDVVAVLQVEEAAPGQSSEAGEDAREMGAPQPFVSLD